MRGWPIVLAAGLGIAVLLSLGVWQLHRLQEKEALLARLEARQAAAPVALETAYRQAAAGADIEFLKVRATGAFQHGNERFLLTVFEGQPGWRVATPFQSQDGILVLVDRGGLPDDLKAPARRPGSQPPGAQAIIGLASRHAGSRNFFTPDNDLKRNIWHWWDIPAMLGPAPAAAREAPFVLHLLPDGSAGFPRPTGLAATLSNNHRQYALTWFALAAVLAVMTVLFLRQRTALR